MRSKAGETTAQFGLWLTQYLHNHLADEGYHVYYDHGDPAAYANVAAIKGFIGDEVTYANRLADVDVIVANEEREILILIEIEETPISPKTLLGDVFANLFCTKYAVNIDGSQRYYSITPVTKLIVASHNPSMKKRMTFVREVKSKIKQTALPDGSISADNIDFIIGQDFEVSIQLLKTRLKRLL